MDVGPTDVDEELIPVTVDVDVDLDDGVDTLVAPMDPLVDDDRFVGVQGRTQSLEGGDVRPIVVDEPVENIAEEIDIDEDKNQDQQAERDMSDIPVELEIRLKKEAKRKRKFKPITSNKRHLPQRVESILHLSLYKTDTFVMATNRGDLSNQISLPLRKINFGGPKLVS
ncbi:hypothetical protein BD560DRAFT_428937 [Blakeslea trispora]|nr:hypothetical protein BD560DRAFT_428937 [Blakeslea trispora]